MNHNSPTAQLVMDGKRATAGLIFGIASAVQFLQTEITIGMLGYTFPPSHAMMVSVVSLLVVFSSSETRDWYQYRDWEKSVVALAVVTMIGSSLTKIGNELITNNAPQAPIAAFGITVIAWGVLAR